MANQGRSWRALTDKIVQVGLIWTQDWKYRWTQWTQNRNDGSWNIWCIAGIYKAKMKRSQISW